MQQYSQYLPSKKFFIVVISIVVIIGVGYGVQTWKKNSQEAQEKEALEKSNQIASSNPTTDSDGDGLMNWEEIRLGTSPIKYDSDSDGTNDGVEISQGRDPLVPGPNDYIHYSSISTSTPIVVSSRENLTETEKMMREILTIANRDTGEDPEFPKTVAKNIIAELDKKTQAFPTSFTLKNVVTVIETSASLKQYGNELGAIFKKFGSPNTEQQKLLYAIMVALKTKDAESFSSLPAIETAKRNEITAVLKLKVPEDLSVFHLDILNELSYTLLAIENISYMVSDPARGLIGMQQYKNATTKLGETISSITTHFENSGISFTKDENGAFLYPTTNTTI
jgi:hypothetical protein